MKQTYEGYKVNTKVYAISHYYKDGKAIDHVAIYEAIVLDVTFRYDKDTNKVVTSYWLKTPGGEEWGDSVEGEFVSDDFNELVGKMKEVWTKNSNNHGE